MILKQGCFFRGAAMMRNRFSFPWQDMLFLRLLEEMQRAGLACRPKLKLANAGLLDSAKESQPMIVVTVHSPVDASLNRAFEECGLDWTLLAAGESAASKARLLGLQSELDLLIRSSDTLLLMRRKLRDGKLVCANIDDARRRPGSLYCDVFVSPAMFQLAIGIKARVVYAFTRVTDAGEIEASFGKPAVDAAACSAEDYARDFIAWMRDAQNDRRKWQVREWVPMTRKDRLRKFVLTESLCARTRD
ncbi:hypothetical protein F8A87_08745 [Betaproteobacteria bacterium SCN2]|nr:hypothetical protein F8A87_08745 [Betaproteobacteria bacterium SCN2]